MYIKQQRPRRNIGWGISSSLIHSRVPFVLHHRPVFPGCFVVKLPFFPDGSDLKRGLWSTPKHMNGRHAALAGRFLSPLFERFSPWLFWGSLLKACRCQLNTCSERWKRLRWKASLWWSGCSPLSTKSCLYLEPMLGSYCTVQFGTEEFFGRMSLLLSETPPYI